MKRQGFFPFDFIYLFTYQKTLFLACNKASTLKYEKIRNLLMEAAVVASNVFQ